MNSNRHLLDSYELAQPLIQQLLKDDIIAECPSWLFDVGIEYYNKRKYMHELTIHLAYDQYKVRSTDGDISFLASRFPDFSNKSFQTLIRIEELSEKYGISVLDTEHLVKLYEL